MTHTTRQTQKEPRGHYDHGTLLSIDDLYPTTKRDKASNSDIPAISGMHAFVNWLEYTTPGNVILAIGIVGIMAAVTAICLASAVALPFDELVRF